MVHAASTQLSIRFLCLACLISVVTPSLPADAGQEQEITYFNRLLVEHSSSAMYEAIGDVAESHRSVDGVVFILRNALKSSDVLVRCQALDGLHQLGAKANKALPAIVARTRDVDSGVRMRAVMALGVMGDAPTTVPILERALEDKDPTVRRASVVALRSLGRDARPAMAALKRVGRASADSSFQVCVASALVEITGDYDALIPILIEGTKSSDMQAVLDALTGLSRTGLSGHRSVPFVLDQLSSENSLIRASAAYTLGSIGPPAKEAIPTLERLRSTDPDVFVRARSAIAIGRIGVRE